MARDSHVVGTITTDKLLAGLGRNLVSDTLGMLTVQDLKEIVKTDNLDEKMLLDTRSLLIAVLEASSDGILITDNKGNIKYVNSAYESTTGLKREQIVGENLQKLLTENIFNTAASLLVLEEGQPVSTLHRYITGRNALTTASPIFDANGNVIGVLNNTRDISNLAKLKHELVETNILISKKSNESQQLFQQLQFEGFIFKSQAMAQTVEMASKAAGFDSTVLISGESGTGKEVFARFIHQHSSKKEGPFVKVNCAAIPSELFESELFGYEPGSFTGANRQGKPGMFELANQGTILLDEVGELSLAAQSKLLRVIQEREVVRIGARKVTEINVRILAATNKNLAQEVKLGNFREDLFFRLNVVPINIPPLRKRKEDISELALYFLERLNRLYRKDVTIASEVIDILTDYSWPGNVRELQNLLEYLFVVNSDEEIGIEQLPTRLLADHALVNYNEKDKKPAEKLSYLLETFEKYIIISSLNSSPSMRKAAKDLGINPSTLSRKIKRYGINNYIP